MKKLIAMLLVVMMAASSALTCSAAGLFPSITVTNTVTCDRDAVRELLTGMGVRERKIESIDGVLAILDAANERLVIADNGVELDLNLNDNTVFALAGELNSGGVAIGSTLFPNHVVTLSPLAFLGVLSQLSAIMARQDNAVLPEGSLFVLLRYSGGLADAVRDAITAGEAEMGEYVIDGETYNARIAMTLDTRAIAESAVGTISRFIHSRPFKALRGVLRKFGINLALKAPEIGSLPSAGIVLYQNLDEAGAVAGPEYGVLEITDLDGETPFAFVGVRLDDGSARVKLEIPRLKVSGDFGFDRTEDGASARLDINAGDFSLGLALAAELGDETHIAFHVFGSDPKAPMLSGELAIVKGGQRTYDVMGRNKTVFSVDGVLAGRRAFRSMASLAADVIFHGIGYTVDTLRDALAEIRMPVAG